MRRFFRRRGVDLGRFVPPETLPEPPLEELVDEGVLLSAAGVRLAVKNLMIIKSIRDGLDYDEPRYRAAVREELENLADEKDADADRIANVRARALTRDGVAEHHADYRAIDTTTLLRREEVSRALADRLRGLSVDESWARSVVADARTAALDEIAASAEARVRAASVENDEEYVRERPRRLRELSDDLLMLQITPPDGR